MMDKYIETLFLIGCYLVVSDKEINALEVEVLDDLLRGHQDPKLEENRGLIFSDAENKPNYYTLLNQLPLVCQNKEQKEQAIRFLAQVACADGFIGSQKQSIINDVASALRIDPTDIVKEEELLSEKHTEDARMSRAKRLWGSAQKVFYDSFFDKTKQHNLDIIFGGAAFQSVLENITDQALIDYERVSQIMKTLGHNLTETRKDVEKLSSKQLSKKQELMEIHKVLTDVHNHFRELIDVSLAENLEMLDKKQRNIRFFTIAFMGRTKAGKSTLHKVMTQEVSDDIGIGKLRTTRYNRSWYWDKLRIVDTPGIGAPGGEVDTDIAKSIIDEADLICYVVTNDSIQETEFNFFDTIKEHNKPLYIILNVKSNLSDGKRLEKFLNNPTKWKDTDGRESIQGHIDRIHDKLDGKYNMNAVKIIPLHLLAAQIAMCTDKEKSIAQVLLKGSNFLKFTNSIKYEVYDSGCLKKSLSVIEGSAYQVHQISKKIKADCEILENKKESLKSRFIKYQRFLSTESTRLLSDVEAAYEAGRSALRSRAAVFASSHYDDKNAGKEWQKDLVVQSTYKQLNQRITNRIEDFSQKSKTELEELFSDISVTLNVNSYSTVSGAPIRNVRLGVGIVSALVTLVVSFFNPLLGLGVGIVSTKITSLFPRKEDRVRKATEELKNQLVKEIDKNMEKSKTNGLAQLRQYTNKIKEGIDAPFNMYIYGVNEIVEKMKSLIETIDFNETVINALIGFRILDFVGKSPMKDRKVSNLTNLELVNHFPVERDWDNHTLIYLYPTKCFKKQIIKAEAATQMNIKTKE